MSSFFLCAAQNSSNKSETQNPAAEPGASSTTGTAQNALEFLKGTAGQSEITGESGTGSSSTAGRRGESSQAAPASAQADGQQAGQGEGQETAQADGQEAGKTNSQDNGQSQDAQQTDTSPKTAPIVPPAETSPALPAEPEEESTAGASQNALEYLTGESARTGDASGDEADATPPEGTLNIQDLLNAQGVGNTTGALPAPNESDDKQNPDDTPSEKDGGGL